MRDWAIARTLDLCLGFNAQQYDLEPPFRAGVVEVNIREGKEAAVQQALQDIVTAERRIFLVQAGRFLFENNAFPYAEVYPGAGQRFGLLDLTKAWDLAVDLVLCREQGPCGPNSVQVLIFCRDFGCPQGLDLMAAYRRDLPPYLFQLVEAFEKWLTAQRRRYHLH